eukprot:9066771-Karenia_brevis.AAC.1
MPTVPIKQHEHRERTHMYGFIMSPFSLEQGFHHAAEEHLRGKHEQPRVEPPPRLPSAPVVRGVYAKKRRLKLDTSKVPPHKICWKSVIRQLVTKALSRKEIAASPEAQAAIRKEADALTAIGAWDISTVTELVKLKAAADKAGKKIVLGDLLILGSIKFFERAKHFWKYK